MFYIKREVGKHLCQAINFLSIVRSIKCIRCWVLNNVVKHVRSITQPPLRDLQRESNEKGNNTWLLSWYFYPQVTCYSQQDRQLKQWMDWYWWKSQHVRECDVLGVGMLFSDTGNLYIYLVCRATQWELKSLWSSNGLCNELADTLIFSKPGSGWYVATVMALGQNSLN